MARQPNYAVPTGEFIQEWMNDNGVNAADLARRLDVTPKHVSELVRAKVALTPEVAVGLERVTGVPAEHWSRLEATYRSDLVRLEQEKALADQYDRVKSFPIKYLRDLGFVEADSQDKASVVAEVLRFFRVVSVDALETTWSRGVAYRKTASANPQREALRTWLTAAERGVAFDSLARFDKDALQKLLPALRALSCDEPSTYVGTAIDALADVGVALCFVPEVPGLGIHGATRWIDGHPVIQLSLRGKTDDQLWFTLFHEIGHVLLHDSKSLFLEGSGDDREREADQFAADTLIPPEAAARMPRNRNLDSVREFAAEIGVAPGVVIGRIHRETACYNWGHQLKQHFEFSYQRGAA